MVIPPSSAPKQDSNPMSDEMEASGDVREPRDDDEDLWFWPEPDEDYCDHADAEIDWEGRARCACGKVWWLTAEELEAHDKAMAEFYATCEREERRERSLLWRAWRWLQRQMPRWRRRPKAEIDADEIPF